MHRDDVRVAEACQRTRLAVEALGGVRAGRALRREHLERDEPVQRWLAGLVNRAHPTRAEQG